MFRRLRLGVALGLVAALVALALVLRGHRRSWAQGLAAAAFALDLLSAPRVAQADYQALVSSAPEPPPFRLLARGGRGPAAVILNLSGRPAPVLVPAGLRGPRLPRALRDSERAGPRPLIAAHAHRHRPPVARAAAVLARADRAG